MAALYSMPSSSRRGFLTCLDVCLFNTIDDPYFFVVYKYRNWTNSKMQSICFVCFVQGHIHPEHVQQFWGKGEELTCTVEVEGHQVTELINFQKYYYIPVVLCEQVISVLCQQLCLLCTGNEVPIKPLKEVFFFVVVEYMLDLL